MGDNTLRNHLVAEATIYWRRRVVVLAAALAALALASWGLSDALAAVGLAGAARQSAAGSNGRGPGRQGVQQAGSSGASASPGPSSSPGVGVLAGSAAISPAMSSTGPSASAGRTASPNASQPAMPALCGWQNISLSLSANHDSFGRHQSATFGIEVASAQQASCSFDIGPRYVALLIKKGSARIWNSADCAKGSGDLMIVLMGGVPTTLHIRWNKRTSAPGCTSRRREAPGTYTAYAVDGSLVSAPVTFKLT